MHDPSDATTYGFMFDLVCNENRYTPVSGHRVLDLGAHFGFFSLFCATRGCDVVAYEPDPDNFNRLIDASERAKEIGLGSIKARNEAVWSAATPITLFREHHSGTSNTVSHGTPRVIVQAVSLQTALEGKNWDCVKMDVEGAEFEILTKARDEDLKRIRYLSLELHNHIGNDPQPRYEALWSKLSGVFDIRGQEIRDGRFCKAFCTLKS